MRILLVVSSSALAGTERHVVSLAEGLRAADIDCAVVHDSGAGGLSAEFDRIGIDRIALPLTGAAIARSAPRLALLFRDADVVHTHLTEATAASALAARVIPRPLVETRHFVDLAHQSRRGLGRMARGALGRVLRRQVALTLCPSAAVMARMGTAPCRLVPHGIEAGPEPRRRDQAHRFVTVGRLEPERHPEDVLLAFAAASERLDADATLDVVGDGSLRRDLETLAGDIGLSGRVSFRGWLPDVRPILDECDVYVTAGKESFGLAALEAMAAGLPVVAVGSGGTADLVEDGVTGILSAEGPAALATALVELGRLDMATMSGEARRRATSRFSRASMVKATVDAYRSVIGDKLRVLRIYHSGVVSEWRERERCMDRRGVDIRLVTPRRWREGSRTVTCDPQGDGFVRPVRTFGRHPALFLYSPLGIAAEMRRRHHAIVDAHEEPFSLALLEILALRRLLLPRASLTFYTAQNIKKSYPPPFRWIEALTFRRASAAYPCSLGAATVIEEKGYAGTLAVVPLGVDLSQFSPVGGDPLPAAPFRVGFAGRLTPEKGVHVLIAAVSEDDGWRLEIAGDGPQRRDLEKQARDSGIADRITFLGAIPRTALPAFFGRQQVVCVPSIPTRRWTEQFCRVAVEAMAAGVTVVASDTGSLPEIVGPAGRFVPPDDVHALRKELRRLGSRPGERARLNGLARDWSARYSWDAVASAHIALYEQARTS